MKDTHKIYEAPTLKAVRLSSGPMMETISGGLQGVKEAEAESKAFWGPSLFDEEDEEDVELDLSPQM